MDLGGLLFHVHSVFALFLHYGDCFQATFSLESLHVHTMGSLAFGILEVRMFRKLGV